MHESRIEISFTIESVTTAIDDTNIGNMSLVSCGPALFGGVLFAFGLILRGVRLHDEIRSIRRPLKGRDCFRQIRQAYGTRPWRGLHHVKLCR